MPRVAGSCGASRVETSGYGTGQRETTTTSNVEKGPNARIESPSAAVLLDIITYSFKSCYYYCCHSSCSVGMMTRAEKSASWHEMRWCQDVCASHWSTERAFMRGRTSCIYTASCACGLGRRERRPATCSVAGCALRQHRRIAPPQHRQQHSAVNKKHSPASTSTRKAGERLPARATSILRPLLRCSLTDHLTLSHHG